MANDLITTMTQDNGPDLVMGWAADLRKGEYGFLPAVAYALEQFDKRNNKPIYRLISFVKGRAFDNGDEKALKLVANGDAGAKLKEYDVPLQRILDKALSNVKFTFREKEGKMRLGVVVKDNGGLNHDVLRDLQSDLKLHNNRISVRSDLFKSMFPPKAKAKATVKEDTKDQSLAKAEKAAKDRTMEDLAVILANKRAELAALEALVSHKQKAEAI